MTKAKYKFRKFYFILSNRKLIAQNVWSCNAWQYKDKAQNVCNEKPIHSQTGALNEPPIVHEVHGFYLVHESLFEQILLEWSKEGD